MTHEASRLYGKDRRYILECSVDYERRGDYEVFTFRDRSFIEIDTHWGRQQSFYPNGWNCTPIESSRHLSNKDMERINSRSRS